MSAVLDRKPLHAAPKARGASRFGAFGLALAVHLLLFLLLAVGVSWKTSEPVTVEAELWSTIPQVAAPAPPPAPVPEPAPPPPAPVPRVEPEPAAPQPKPDIALEAQRKAEQRTLEEQKKAEKKQGALKKAEAEKAERDQEAKLEAQKKADAEKRFNENLARLKQEASGTSSTANAAATSGPKGDPTYAGRIAQLIRGNTTFTDPADNIPRAEFAVELDPAGYVLSVKKTKSSGNVGWDAAVERAIRKSEPFPADKTGRAPPSLLITHCPTC